MAILCRKSATATSRIMQGLILSVSLFLSCSLSYAQVIFTDDFEGGNLSKTQNGFKWTSSASTKVVSFQGTQALRFWFGGTGAGSGDAWAEQRFFLGSYYRDVWIQYDVYIPTNYIQRVPPSGSKNDKAFVQLWTDTYKDTGVGIKGGFHSFADGNGLGDLGFLQASPPNTGLIFQPGAKHIDKSELGKWTRVVINIRAGTGSSDGLARVWKDGVLIYDYSKAAKPNNNFTKFMYEPGRNNRFNNGYLLGWSNSGFAQDTLIYIDNFIFSTTPLNMNFDPPSAPIAQ